MLQTLSVSRHWKSQQTHQGHQVHQDHQVAISIWIISVAMVTLAKRVGGTCRNPTPTAKTIAMIASTLFHMLQTQTVSIHWKGQQTHQGHQVHQAHQVAIPFWIISFAMAAHTLFFILLLAQTVSNHWKNIACNFSFWKSAGRE